MDKLISWKDRKRDELIKPYQNTTVEYCLRCENEWGGKPASNLNGSVPVPPNWSALSMNVWKNAIVECNLPCRGRCLSSQCFFKEQMLGFDWFFGIAKNAIQNVIQWVFCAGSEGGSIRAGLIGSRAADRVRGFLQLEQGRRRHHCYGYSSPTFSCLRVSWGHEGFQSVSFTPCWSYIVILEIFPVHFAWGLFQTAGEG